MSNIRSAITCVTIISVLLMVGVSITSVKAQIPPSETLKSLTPLISNNYVDSKSGIEITFPDGWSGFRSSLANYTVVTVYKNSTELIPTTINLEIADKSQMQKLVGAIMNLAKNSTIAQKSQSMPKECDLTYSKVDVNEMGGYDMTMQCAGWPFRYEGVMFESDKNIVYLFYFAQPTEFEKHRADFNNTLNTLRIPNAANSFNLTDFLPQNTSLDSTSTLPISSNTQASPIPTTATQRSPPPLKQIRSGIVPSYIECNQGFTLIYKAEDNSPACVKINDAPRLVQIGWAKPGG